MDSSTRVCPLCVLSMERPILFTRHPVPVSCCHVIADVSACIHLLLCSNAVNGQLTFIVAQQETREIFHRKERV